MPDSLLAPTSAGADSDALPSWAAPATPQRTYTTIGISAEGDLYVYGDTASKRGPVVPALVGLVIDIQISRHGLGSRYGERDYLELHLQGPIPGEVAILRLPCQSRNGQGVFTDQSPWTVRTLLGALLMVDVQTLAVKLQAKRGNSANFIQVFPFDQDGNELPEVRSDALAPGRADLETAIDTVRSALNLPPQFVQ